MEKIEYKLTLDTEGGNSGSPICLVNSLSVVGIHKEGDSIKPINYGTFLGYILDKLENMKKNRKRINYSKL